MKPDPVTKPLKSLSSPTQIAAVTSLVSQLARYLELPNAWVVDDAQRKRRFPILIVIYQKDGRLGGGLGLRLELGLGDSTLSPGIRTTEHASLISSESFATNIRPDNNLASAISVIYQYIGQHRTGAGTKLTEEMSLIGRGGSMKLVAIRYVPLESNRFLI